MKSEFMLWMDDLKHIAVDSPDGLITSNHNEIDPNCCNADLNFDEISNISVEIKSPYPDAL